MDDLGSEIIEYLELEDILGLIKLEGGASSLNSRIKITFIFNAAFCQ